MKIDIPYLVGESRLVYPAAPSYATEKWFINDHCFVIDREGTVHFLGINNPYPEDLNQLYVVHPFLGHAVTKNPLESWERKADALDDSGESRYLGAAYVVWLEDQRCYVMLFESKIDGHRVLELAYSEDLYKWERSRQKILSNLPETTRDPCIVQMEDSRFFIYLCTPNPEGSSITVTETRDFKTFEHTRICLNLKDGVTYGGMESPLMIRHNGLFYLFFTYAHRHYYEEIVCVSDKPDEFSMDRVVTTLYGHACELLNWQGKTYISSCGPEDSQNLNNHGLYLAELRWLPQDYKNRIKRKLAKSF